MNVMTLFVKLHVIPRGFPGGASGKMQETRHGFDPSVKKVLWRMHGDPLQYSCLENPMDRGAWWARVTWSQTQLKQPSVHACDSNEI